MRRILKVSTAVIIICALCLVSYMLFFNKVQYSTYGAVTYFDENGQYQLVNSAAEDYAVYDAEKEKFIDGFVLYYIPKEDNLYMIMNSGSGERVYAVLNTQNGNFAVHQNIEEFEDDEQKILTNTDDMVDLTKKRSQNLKHMMKFIPQEWRKW